MVTSGKNTVIRGNTAPSFNEIHYAVPARGKDRERLRVVEPQKKATEKKSVKKTTHASEKTIHPLKLVRNIAIMAVCFVTALLMVNRYSVIAKNNVAIENLRAQLHESNRQIEQLEVDLSLKQSLDSVMKTASTQMNMGNPTPDQIRKIALTDPAQAAQAAQPKADEGTWLSRLFTRVISILE